MDSLGEPVLLADQDRARWDRAMISEGLSELNQAARHQHVGPYFLQAAIAAEHGLPATAAATNWARIARLYGMLADVTPSPVIELNRLVAVSMAEGS